MIGRAETVRIGTSGWVLLATVLVVVLLAVAVLVVAMQPRQDASPPAAATGPAPDADVTMHEIWASSPNNTSVDVPAKSWVMTDFRVTLPYIRSVEVGAAPAGFGGDSHGANVLLRVVNQAGQEIDSGEAPIVGYRAKYVFSHSVDVRAYKGGHLYLQLYNLSGAKVRAFFTRDDRDPGITSYIPCPNPLPTQCPNRTNVDLDALVIGRTGTW